MAFRYRFTGDTPLVMFGLGHGETTVTRDGEPVDEPEGSTVVAQLGDVIETQAEYPHAHLELIDADKPAPAPVPTVAELRKELKAAGVAFDPKAKKDELLAIWNAYRAGQLDAPDPDEHDDENPDAGGSGDNGDDESTDQIEDAAASDPVKE